MHLKTMKTVSFVSTCFQFVRIFPFNFQKYFFDAMCVTDYRSHTIRMKRWLPEIEQKIKYAFNVLKNENEAVQFLLNLGLTSHEIDLVLQNFLTNTELNIRKREQYQKMDNLVERTPLSEHEQQLELIGFSQGVSHSKSN